MIHVISLGAGVQSSCMALQAAKGRITPMPLCGIFADPQWEAAGTYKWLSYLIGAKLLLREDGRLGVEPGTYQSGQLPYPVHIVTAGDLRTEQVTSRMRGYKQEGTRWASLPYFTQLEGAAREGRTKRQCTAEYKIEPIEAFIRREILGLKYRQKAPKRVVITQWRGISTDEAQRMKPSREPWMVVRYPLAMELGFSRQDCVAWMERHGYPKPPRSACIGCPFHSDDEWLRMQKETPEEFADAVDFDARIREAGGMRGKTFLHRSCAPLGEIDFALRVDGGNLDMWGNECEGMCGV